MIVLFVRHFCAVLGLALAFLLTSTMLSASTLMFSAPCVAVAAADRPSATSFGLADIFRDHMVLQRGRRIPVWGRGEPGSSVSIGFNKQIVEARCNASGVFRVDLKPELAGGPYTLLLRTVKTKGEHLEVRLTDVMVGEVWLCAGQSNMEFAVNKLPDKEQLLNQLNSNLRLFVVGKAQSYQPIASLKGRWFIADKSSVGEFSAVALSFGKKLQTDLRVPVGIILVSMPGCPIDPWIPQRILQYESPYERIYRERKLSTESATGSNPEPLIAGRGCSTLYNAMVAPLIPYAIKGVLWYQGEGNLGGHGDYRRHFPAMIDAWRVAWQQKPKDFAFVYVQLPSCKLFVDKLGDGVWAQMREAQDNALRLGNTFRVSAIDLGAPDELHPPRKYELGQRAGAVALSRVYAMAQAELAPEAVNFRVSKSRVLIAFGKTGGHLRFTGGASFALSGRDGIFHVAQAKIDGNVVALWSEHVSEPRQMRYAWADAPRSLLENAWSIPAAPFTKLLNL